jgi:membrane-associated protease RseP (regulator of RpoE activity)
MFDERSYESPDYKAPAPITSDGTRFSTQFRQLEALVTQVMAIEERRDDLDPRIAAAFVGQLTLPSAQAFAQLDEQVTPLEMMSFFSTIPEGDLKGKHQILIIRERPNPAPRPWWPNALLFVLTLFSTMWAGAVIEGVELESLEQLFTQGKLLEGLPYMLSLILILGAHELGHYFAARYHRVDVTLPYFIPLPIGLFGTMGAFIQQRTPPRNRRQLFDIGAAGPLAGLLFAIPIIWIGIATSEVGPLPTEADCAADSEQCAYIMEGNSLLYGVSKYVIHGRWLPSNGVDMTLNQLAFAGWTGLFVTAINLIPVGQFDGGHIIYTLLGQNARRLYVPALVAAAGLAFIYSGWFLWVLLIFFLGRNYNTPMDDITPLDPSRRLIGIIALAFFLLIFTPNPFMIITLN